MPKEISEASFTAAEKKFKNQRNGGEYEFEGCAHPARLSNRKPNPTLQTSAQTKSSPSAGKIPGKNQDEKVGRGDKMRMKATRNRRGLGGFDFRD